MTAAVIGVCIIDLLLAALILAISDGHDIFPPT